MVEVQEYMGRLLWQPANDRPTVQDSPAVWDASSD